MFKLKIEFGGLCMFVRRPAAGATAFSILMPEHDEHVARVIYKTGGKCAERDLDPETVVYLNGPAMGGSSSVKIPPALLPISEGLGSRVNAAFLTSSKPAKCIRFDLSFPEKLNAFGQDAKIEVVPWKASPNPYPAVGRVRAVWSVDDTKITIGKDDYEPDSTGWLNLEVFNSPTGASDPHHEKGDELHHLQAYLGLLDPKPSAVFKVGETGDAYDIGECDEVYRTTGRLGPRSIDPFQCTASRGCDPEDPDCVTLLKDHTAEGQQIAVDGFASSASRAVADALARLGEIVGPQKSDSPRLFFPKGIGEITASVTASAAGASPNFGFSLAIRESPKP